jgi:hypothetical protein
MESKHIIYECGSCGSYHPWDFKGDCRDDANRFADSEDYLASLGILTHLYEIDVETRCMCDRLKADGCVDALPCPMCGRKS